MYTFIIFIIICALEFAVISFYWSKITDYRDIARDAADITTLSKGGRYNKVVRVVGNILNNFRPIIYGVLGVLALINLIVAMILGGIAALIEFLVTL